MASLLAVVWALPHAAAQNTASSPLPGPQVLTYLSSVDDTEQPYAVYLPKRMEPGQNHPLVVALHGEGSDHRLNLRRVFGRGNLPGQSDAEASRWFPPLPEVDFIVVSPYARGTIGYTGLGERDVYDVVAEVKRRFPVDEDRIYLTGLSMGGGGALWLGLTRPDLWAGLAPVCPAMLPAGTGDLAMNALNLPVRFFQGENDPLVPASSSREWHKRFLGLDTVIDYIEYPNVRHNAWDMAYRNASIFEWFAGRRRERFPERVRFASRFYEYRSAYWMEMDSLTPGTLASIDIRFTAPNRLSAETRNLDGFTLRLAGHASFRAAGAVEVVIDGTKVALTGRNSELSFSRVGTAWKAGLYRPAPGEKRQGAEGPMLRAVSSKQIYVYGTADSPLAAEIERRRQEAEQAVRWSATASIPAVKARVTADRDLEERHIGGANLVLFGTRETNSLIARWADLLPMALNAGAADFGLLQVAHVEGNYLLVSSGLPWWAESSSLRTRTPDFVSKQLGLLMGFGDYLLFRRSVDNVVAEGVFQRDWRLPLEEAAKIRATGAVSLRSGAGLAGMR